MFGANNWSLDLVLYFESFDVVVLFWLSGPYVPLALSVLGFLVGSCGRKFLFRSSINTRQGTRKQTDHLLIALRLTPSHT